MMADGVRRLRMFAGPNGSGKTTVKNSLRRSPDWFGIYINPDELESAVKSSGSFSLPELGLQASTQQIRQHFEHSEFLKSRGLHRGCSSISSKAGVVDFEGVDFTAYHASVFADFLRRQALAAGKSFTFETVMSSVDKVELLALAQKIGFRTYLYFIATEDPVINVQRVRNRVIEGGHDVPEDKIISRYSRSIANLPQAIKHSTRAFLFDTSEAEAWYFAEVRENGGLELKSDLIPGWFKSVWQVI